MALFDGPVRGFAEKFCAHLDERVAARVEEGKKAEDPGHRAMYFTIAMCLQEVSEGLRTIVLGGK